MKMTAWQGIEHFYREYADHSHPRYDSDTARINVRINELSNRCENLLREVRGEEIRRDVEFAGVLRNQATMFDTRLKSALLIIAENFNKLQSANVEDFEAINQRLTEITEKHNTVWRESLLPWLGISTNADPVDLSEYDVGSITEE